MNLIQIKNWMELQLETDEKSYRTSTPDDPYDSTKLAEEAINNFDPMNLYSEEEEKIHDLSVKVCLVYASKLEKDFKSGKRWQ